MEDEDSDNAIMMISKLAVRVMNKSDASIDDKQKFAVALVFLQKCTREINDTDKLAELWKESCELAENATKQVKEEMRDKLVELMESGFLTTGKEH